MVLVKKSNRGKGISKLLLSGLFEKLKNCPCIKLDATPAGKPVYEKFGFVLEYSIFRMTNPCFDTIQLSLDTNRNIEVAIQTDFMEIVEFDQQIFGADRQNLIRFLTENNSDGSWILKNEGEINGFVLGRKGSRFYQIGPVSASSLDNAKQMISMALQHLDGNSVVVDVASDHILLVKWLEQFGFTIQRPFYRMFRNNNHYPGTPEKQFLICGPEFG